MKKIILTWSLFLFVVIGYSQVTSVADFRVANATTAFGVNLPIGTKVYDIANNKYYVAKAGVASTATLTSASASFSLLNDAGTDSQSINLTDNTLSISGNESTADLSGYLDNTDNQTLSIDSTDRVFTLTLEDGGSIKFKDLDEQTAAEVEVSTITNLDATTVQAALAELQGDINGIDGTDNQNLSYNSETHAVDIVDGNSATLPLAVDDGATEGLASFTAADFNVTGGNVAIDYANGQTASNSQSGFATAAHITAIEANTAKVSNVTTDLGTTTTTTSVTVTSSDGTDATINAATTEVAGVMTTAQVTKLDGIDAGAEVNLTMVTESFETNSTPDYAFTLGHFAVTAQGCVVSVNGAIIPPANYTLASASITIDNTKNPLYQYDKIVITYSY